MTNKKLQAVRLSACAIAIATLTACGGESDTAETQAVIAKPAEDQAPSPSPASGACKAAAVTWTVAGATCTANIAATASGANAEVKDLSAPSFGAASFSCSNGVVSSKPAASLAASCLNAPLQGARLHGYLGYNPKSAPQDYDGGYSMYTAAFPLYGVYTGEEVQSGLPGTWMKAKGQMPAEAYQTIEGGLGWWHDTVFGVETPKFHIGAVATDFSSVSNGPGNGWGGWGRPSGKYAVAQLSNKLVWPLDGLNLKKDTNGELLGTGYLPLPFTDSKSTTNGIANKPTGDNSWTLFINAANFKGPATFVLPYFFSHVTTTDRKRRNKGFESVTIDTSQHFDANPSNPNKAHQMETQYVPAYMSKDAKGDTYARVAPVQFPRDNNGNSILTNRLMVYKKAALWDSVESWFKKGGAATDSQIKLSESYQQDFQSGGWSSWSIYTDSMAKADNKPVVDWNSITETVAFDAATVGYRWKQDNVTKKDLANGSVVALPQYYRMTKLTTGQIVWTVVQIKDVPVETGLTSIEFKQPVRDPGKFLTTPMDNPKLLPANDNTWTTPGPSKGPFTADLSDGSTLTYYWYKFMDQPSMLNSDLTLAERQQMQIRVEKLHNDWTITKEYLAPPTTGKLASIDPKLIITPPAGLEVGYVPIAVRQALTAK
jgi:hypothetical protein